MNLESREGAFVARKTGRPILLPPLLDYLATLPAGDDPDAPLLPRSATATRTGTRRDTARESVEFSFHCLRFAPHHERGS